MEKIYLYKPHTWVKCGQGKNWGALSDNINAVHFLEENRDKICWWMLSSNINAIHLLDANPDKIYWIELSSNLNAIHLLEKNMDG